MDDLVLGLGRALLFEEATTYEAAAYNQTQQYEQESTNVFRFEHSSHCSAQRILHFTFHPVLDLELGVSLSLLREDGHDNAVQLLVDCVFCVDLGLCVAIDQVSSRLVYLLASLHINIDSLYLINSYVQLRKRDIEVIWDENSIAANSKGWLSC